MTNESTEHEKQSEQFAAAMKHRFPTFAGVVSLGSDTSTAMKAELAALRKQAIADRAAKQKRT